MVSADRDGTSLRIDVLDVIRGVAILLIFFFNIPDMGNSNYEHFGATQLLGWRPVDQACWWFLTVFIEGTQRGLLQILFGTGALILLRKTLASDGPVEPVDQYFRRNLWLMVFGLFDIFGLLWFGDILLAYAIAAIFLIPFRRLSPKTLLAVSLLFSAQSVISGSISYQKQLQVYHVAVHAMEKQANHVELSGDDRSALMAHENGIAVLHPSPTALKEERDARFGTVPAYVQWFHSIWLKYLWEGGGLKAQIVSSFFTMLLGMSLFKLGIVQGERTRRFYTWLALVCYIPGLVERTFSDWQHVAFSGLPNVETAFGEPARLLVTVGHIALINLVMKTNMGRALLAPFRAPGRTAFTLYLMQNFLGDWILFPGFAFGLWGRYGWFGLTAIGLLVITAQLIVSNLWLRRFSMGPLEWLWRSLLYQRSLPIRYLPGNSKSLRQQTGL